MREFLNTAIEVKHMSWPAHNSLPHCSGACGQGRHACITPDICTQAEDDSRPPMTVQDAAMALLLTFGAWAVPVGLVALLAVLVAP